MKLKVRTPYPVYTGADGTPLENGQIFIGNPNLNAESHPQTVYWDSDLTIPASQPIATKEGYPSRNGSPGSLYVPGDYSILIKDSAGAIIFSALHSPDSEDALWPQYSYFSVEKFGAKVGDDVSGPLASLIAAGLPRAEFVGPGTYYIGTPVPLPADFTIHVAKGATVQASAGNPQLFKMIGVNNTWISGDGRISGNGETFDYLATSGGITDGDLTGTADANASGTTLTINALGTGLIEPGCRMEWISGGVTYGRIITGYAPIVAGTASVTVNAAFSPAIVAGQNIYIKQPANRIYMLPASSGATTATFVVGDVNSGAGGYLRQGDQMFAYGNNNSVDDADIDTTAIIEIGADAAWALNASGYWEVTATLKSALSATYADPTMMTSVQDHRNNEWTAILGIGTQDCGVKGLKFSNLSLHGAMANATIRAPSNGLVMPSNQNKNFQIIDLTLEGDIGDGSAFGGAHCASITAENISGRDSASKHLLQFEQCANPVVNGFYAEGMQTGCMMTGDTYRYSVEGTVKNCQIGLDLRAQGGSGRADIVAEMGATSLYAVRVEDIDNVDIELIADGAGKVTGTTGGSHLYINPQSSGNPDKVSVRIKSTNAGRSGIYCNGCDDLTILPGSSVTGSGYQNVYINAAPNVSLGGLAATDAAQTSAAAGVHLKDCPGADIENLVSTGPVQTYGLFTEGTTTIDRIEGATLSGATAPLSVPAASISGPVNIADLGVAVYATEAEAIAGADQNAEAQAAMDAVNGDLMFGGHVLTDDKLICPTECRPIAALGRERSGLVVDSGFNMAATSILEMKAGDGGEIGEFGWFCDQPSAPANRAAMNQYPPALDISYRTRLTMDNIRMRQAWDGVYGVGNFGGLKGEGTWEIGAFNEPYNIDGSLDFGYVQHVHLWPFSFAGNATLLAIYEDGSANSTFGRWDGGGGFRALEVHKQKVTFSSTTGLAPNSFDKIALDGDEAVLEATSGRIEVGTLTKTGGGSGLQSVLVNGAEITFDALFTAGTQKAISVSSGRAQINGGEGWQDSVSTPWGDVTGGELAIADMRMKSPASRTEYFLKQSGTGKLSILGGTTNVAASELGVQIGADVAGAYVDMRKLHPLTLSLPATTTGDGWYSDAEIDWTPTLVPAVLGDWTPSYGILDAQYRLDGDMVGIRCRLRCTPTFTTASGSLTIQGLPVLPVLTGRTTEFDISWNTNIAHGVRYGVAGRYVGGDNFLELFLTDGNAGAAALNVSNITSGNTVDLLFTANIWR